MTAKEASNLKKGDKVVMTRDPTVHQVTAVICFRVRDVEVRFGTPVRRLRGAAALRSLKRAKP